MIKKVNNFDQWSRIRDRTIRLAASFDAGLIVFSYMGLPLLRGNTAPAGRLAAATA